jgi:hypothetical protein
VDVMTLKERCDRLRAALMDLEVQARQLKEHPEIKESPTYDGQRGEMIAQSMLAVRDIEAARMRLGKVLQYAGDGVSIYDKA